MVDVARYWYKHFKTRAAILDAVVPRGKMVSRVGRQRLGLGAKFLAPAAAADRWRAAAEAAAPSLRQSIRPSPAGAFVPVRVTGFKLEFLRRGDWRAAPGHDARGSWTRHSAAQRKDITRH